MADNRFPQGLKGFQKRQGSPDFCVCSIIIEPRALFDWLKTPEGTAALSDYNGTKQLKLQVNKSQTGQFLNFKVDTYQSGGTQQSNQQPQQQAPQQQHQSNEDDGLPF